ncbi:hypothetical protein LMG28727_02929 [Paraburkholderia kirstenboschensis]|uniref:hypothetical protein n=1 Tax=Paraburkholderia kirstenboschensis TaxID=1245436 RepID=UPI000A596CB0|nr:hypothetical protein [Paraburkholderia kirstenboschensis]CAD6532380.1 hypothetical protein LMG28727_02929 [Paraburkholderia kirstenboschensis]
MGMIKHVSVLLLLIPFYAHSEQYVCTPEKMTGFKYDSQEKKWNYAKFKTDFQYVLTPGKGKFAFNLVKVGDANPTGGCEKGFNDAGFLFCSIPDGDFKFNKFNGRYLLVSDIGYYLVGKGMWAETDEDSGDLAFQIGKCKPFN